MSNNPYGKFVEGLDVLRCLEETPRRIETLVRAWPREKDEHAHAPGKWKARQVLTHLAQIELVFAVRLRFALAQDGYVVQPFEQDDWMANESSQPALRRARLVCRAAANEPGAVPRRSLPSSGRRRSRIPNSVLLDVDWLMAWAAGHERNHLPQIEAVAKA